MKRTYTAIGMCLMLASLVFLIGCETVSQREAQMAELRRQENMRLLQEQNRQQLGRIEALEYELGRMDRSIGEVEQSALGRTRDKMAVMEDRISSLEQQFRNLQAQLARDKKEMLDSLSKQIAEVIKRSTPARSSTRRRSSSAYGYEHVVQTGETLSEISQAYGVSIQAIIDENGIDNPNALRVGQTLFIPE